MTPTDEQRACIDAALSTGDNLLIRALAGASKTTTLVWMAEALKGKSILCLAFNVRIVKTMTERLPAGTVCKTFNGLGHGVWGECNGRVSIDTSKVYKIVSKMINALERKEKDRAWKSFADIMKTVELGKAYGWLPETVKRKGLFESDNDFFDSLDEEPSALERMLIHDATMVSLDQCLKERVFDFSDQILMSTLYPCLFPRYDVVLVDEAQDLSPLNHAMLKKLCVKSRLIAVGDEHQAIYGFRGAAENGMDALARAFSMKELTLSTSFRCPKSVVAESFWRTPHMRWPDWAKDGEVRTLQDWNATTVPDGGAILCRNNAPLFGIAIKLLKNGRYPQLIGNDIGKYLLKVMAKFGDKSMRKDDVLAAIERWRAEKLAKARNAGKVHDQALCLQIFAQQGDTLGDMMAYAQYLFDSQGPIQLCTVHKAKGLEYDHVYILDKELMDRSRDQDANVEYVAITRAKETLTYVKSDHFQD